MTNTQRGYGLAERGLAQDLMLGFNVDPHDVVFLRPPSEALVLRPLAQCEGALGREERTGALSGLLLGRAADCANFK